MFPLVGHTLVQSRFVYVGTSCIHCHPFRFIRPHVMVGNLWEWLQTFTTLTEAFLMMMMMGTQSTHDSISG